MYGILIHTCMLWTLAKNLFSPICFLLHLKFLNPVPPSIAGMQFWVARWGLVIRSRAFCRPPSAPFLPSLLVKIDLRYWISSLLSIRPNTANKTSCTYSNMILCKVPENPHTSGSPLSDVFHFSSPSVTPSVAARIRLLARTNWLWHLSAYGWAAEQHCYSSRDTDSPFAPAPWSYGLQRCIFGNLRALSV